MKCRLNDTKLQIYEMNKPTTIMHNMRIIAKTPEWFNSPIHIFHKDAIKSYLTFVSKSHVWISYYFHFGNIWNSSIMSLTFLLSEHFTSWANHN